MLLDAPGIMPTPICLFRQGDVDWLSMRQVDKLLTDEMFRTDDTHRATAGEELVCKNEVFFCFLIKLHQRAEACG